MSVDELVVVVLEQGREKLRKDTGDGVRKTSQRCTKQLTNR